MIERYDDGQLFSEGEIRASLEKTADLVEMQQFIRRRLANVWKSIQENDALTLPAINRPGIEKAISPSTPWYSFSTQQTARLELYRDNDSERYVVSHKVFNDMRFADVPEPYKVSCEDFLVDFPSGLIDPQIQLPPGSVVTEPKLSEEELWSRLHDIMSLS